MAMGPELQQQGYRLRFTWHIQPDVQSLRLELLAQTKDVINHQMFALNFLVFLTLKVYCFFCCHDWLLSSSINQFVLFPNRTGTETYCFQDFVQTQRFHDWQKLR